MTGKSEKLWSQNYAWIYRTNVRYTKRWKILRKDYHLILFCDLKMTGLGNNNNCLTKPRLGFTDGDSSSQILGYNPKISTYSIKIIAESKVQNLFI